MSELKCPFCGQELDTSNPQCVQCKNDYCHPSFLKYGSKELWQALIDTKKELDVAVSQLKKTRDYIEDCRYQETNCFLVDSKDMSIILDETNEALEQINNKDVK